MKDHKRTRTMMRVALVLVAVLLIGLLAACQSESATPAEAPAMEEPAAAAEEMVAEEPADEPDQSAADETVAEEPAVEEPGAESDMAAGMRQFSIVPEGTEARFIINEVLMGDDKTVVGVTSEVTGDIKLDPTNPGASEIGVITINARDFTTDADRRNGANQRFILQSDQDDYQYITFTPTAVDGLPDAVSVGEPFSFQVTGDLKIRDAVQPATFDVEVTANSESEISGLATTEVLYKDFGLTIPEVPMVASVEDNVILELAFTAMAE